MGKSAYHHGRLKESLIEAAIQEVEQVGTAGLSLRALSRTVGVSPNAPYRHFPNKGALMAEVAALGYRQLAALLNEVSASPESLPTAVETYVAYLERRPGMAQILMDRELAERDSPELQAARSDLFGAWLRHVKPRQAEAPPTLQIARVAEAWSLAEGFVRLRQGGALKFLPETIRPSARQLV